MRSAPLRRALHRSRSRGAAIFVVALVITLLMGIGVFASRSASLSTAATGHQRQLVQTRYLTDFAVLLAANKLGDMTQAAAFAQQMKNPPQFCEAQAGLLGEETCYKLPYKQIRDELAVSGCPPLNAGGTKLQQCPASACEPVLGSDPANQIPGSLGMADLEGDFLVELTDLLAGPPRAGDNYNPGNQIPTVKFVTVTAFGQVRIRNTGGAVLDPISSGSASTLKARAIIASAPIFD